MNQNSRFNVAAACPLVKIADPKANVDAITQLCARADSQQFDAVVFPELSITGYTCSDLFLSSELIDSAVRSLRVLVERSAEWNVTVIVGLPLAVENTLYNVAAVVSKGVLYGFVPKSYIPNYNEFYEKRWFASGHGVSKNVSHVTGYDVPLTTRQLFKVNGVTFGIEICEDLWTPVAPGTLASLGGAEVVFNLSATDMLVGKYDYIKQLVSSQSAKNISGYVYTSAGSGESSTDLVFDSIGLVADKGRIIKESLRWQAEEKLIAASIDIESIRHDRMTMSSFRDCAVYNGTAPYSVIEIEARQSAGHEAGHYDAEPFVNRNEHTMSQNIEEVINIQCCALAQRLRATGCRNAVVGVSGGLDSTLALLVAVKTFDDMGLERTGIHAVTMPGFGTSNRTYRNAVDLIKALNLSFREISIVAAVRQHFADIGHPENRKDVTYENSQARQRTLLLMDIANQVNGIVIGTGDMSELALGWATYNGDHMSMYGVNAGVPKTLVRHLVDRFTDTVRPLIDFRNADIAEILHDIVNTPISPELIPTDSKGEIAQKTEDLVGPYELHDFFLYYTLRYGLGPEKIFERAAAAFVNKYETSVILKWLRVFTRRFFSQQFKRSCMPDGPKVGSVCLSPRGDWRMPSDAKCEAWLESIDKIEKQLIKP